MAEYEDDDLVHAVESMTCGVLSQQPYWQMDQTQRAEWKRYTQKKQQRQRVQEQVVEEDEDDYTSASGEEGEEEVEEKGEEDKTTPEEEGEEEEPATTERVDRRKLWVQYQAIARNTLRESQNKSKIPLSEVNDKARAMWAEDGWAKGK
jgi:hypothetical protein